MKMFVVLNISDSDKHRLDAIKEYEKRLWKTIKIENLKPIKNGTKGQIIGKETKIIFDKIEKKI